MNKILCLQGEENSGKTTTIWHTAKKLLFHKDYSRRECLSDFFENSEKIGDNDYIKEDTKDKDFRIILQYKNTGILIGIESQGDPNSRLEESLDIFKNNGCAVIVCACQVDDKMGGSIVQLVESMACNYDIWYKKVDRYENKKLKAEAQAQNISTSLVNAVEEICSFLHLTAQKNQPHPGP